MTSHEYANIHKGRCAQRAFAQRVVALWKLEDNIYFQVVEHLISLSPRSGMCFFKYVGPGENRYGLRIYLNKKPSLPKLKEALKRAPLPPRLEDLA